MRGFVRMTLDNHSKYGGKILKHNANMMKTKMW